MPGWENQQTGDAGQSLIEAELVMHGFLVGPLQPDPGEDFWVECQGRRAIAEGSFPLRALLQVKSSATVQSATFTDDLPLTHIKRWAAQPLPVFLIGVTTAQPSAFYAKSVDDILAHDLQGQDPTTLTTKTVRVKLPSVADLSALLTDAIHEHHRSMQLVLKDLSETEIEQHYFEVLKKKKPETWERVPIASWTVLWKSPPRPQHFAAMLTELTRRAKADCEKTFPCPAFVIFHVYRSLYDVQYNLAVARVDWVNPGHPKAAAIAERMGAPGGLKVRHDRDTSELRDIFRSQTVSEDAFAAYASSVGTAFDRITDAILTGPGGIQAWNDELRRQFKEADDLWNSGPFAPVQYAALAEALSTYNGVLFGHESVAIYRAPKLTPDVTARLLRDSEVRLRDLRGAWRILLPASL